METILEYIDKGYEVEILHDEDFFIYDIQHPCGERVKSVEDFESIKDAVLGAVLEINKLGQAYHDCDNELCDYNRSLKKTENKKQEETMHYKLGQTVYFFASREGEIEIHALEIDKIELLKYEGTKEVFYSGYSENINPNQYSEEGRQIIEAKRLYPTIERAIAGIKSQLDKLKRFI